MADRSGDAQYFVAVFKPAVMARACREAAYAGLKHDTAEGGGVLHTVLEPQAFDLMHKTMDAVMVGLLDPDVLKREAGFGTGSDFRFAHGDPRG